ncbi:prealbumin-like fold domain-containing protein [Streptomyces sp. NPDC052101]|uniref:prealbumin-like fold domain-containing protein n=1 Tax=Streptomyces sp. NPDC052101 TaxID=3155763 RepID=UPI003441AE95
MNIGSGTSRLLTLTTGANGTASGELPVPSRKTEYWVEEIKAPAGCDLYKPSKSFTAGPGAPVTVTVTNAKTATDPKPDPADKPTHKPAAPRPHPRISRAAGPEGSSLTRRAPAHRMQTPSFTAADLDSDSAPKAPAGALAHTGAITLVAVRRRSSTEFEPDDSGKTS